MYCFAGLNLRVELIGALKHVHQDILLCPLCVVVWLVPFPGSVCVVGGCLVCFIALCGFGLGRFLLSHVQRVHFGPGVCPPRWTMSSKMNNVHQDEQSEENWIM